MENHQVQLQASQYLNGHVYIQKVFQRVFDLGLIHNVYMSNHKLSSWVGRVDQYRKLCLSLRESTKARRSTQQGLLALPGEGSRLIHQPHLRYPQQSGDEKHKLADKTARHQAEAVRKVSGKTVNRLQLKLS